MLKISFKITCSMYSRKKVFLPLTCTDLTALTEDLNNHKSWQSSKPPAHTTASPQNIHRALSLTVMRFTHALG